MAVELGTVFGAALGELRVQPVPLRVRADVGETTVVDTTAARLVWEPRRVVSVYAAPLVDIAGRLVSPDAGGTDDADRDAHTPRTGRVEPDAATLPPVLSPRDPFGVHSAAGVVYDLETEDATLPGAAFVPDDPDLEGYALLDWEAFTRWFEEGQEAVGHPREPFHRIQCLPSTRHVTVEIGGQVVADTRHPTLLLESGLPPRWYLPREDVRMDLLTRSDTRTTCAYKGFATYYSTVIGGERLDDIVWTYEDPRHDADEVRDLMCFYVEHTDTTVDGEQLGRPRTEWSESRT